MKILRIPLLAASFVFVNTNFAASAQQIEKIDVPANPVMVNNEVTMVVNAGRQPPQFCGLLISFGDGTDQQIKINGFANKFPISITKAYNAPGTYTVRAEGKKVTTHFPCMGTATAIVNVRSAVAEAKPNPMPTTQGPGLAETAPRPPSTPNSAVPDPVTKVKPPPITSKSKSISDL